MATMSYHLNKSNIYHHSIMYLQDIHNSPYHYPTFDHSDKAHKEHMFHYGSKNLEDMNVIPYIFHWPSMLVEYISVAMQYKKKNHNNPQDNLNQVQKK